MWFSRPAGHVAPVHPSATIPGPELFAGTAALEQSGVILTQSLFAVPLGPPAHGTHCNVASHPGLVVDPLLVKRKVRQPLASVDV